MPLRFFQIIRDRWTYFLLEILIIIIGITLSLGINNWQQERQKARLEKQYLMNIREELQSDLEELRGDQEARETELALFQQVLSSVQNGRITAGPPVVVEAITYLLTTFFFLPNDAHFETLKSTGQLNIIRNRELLTDLQDLYKTRYRVIEENNEDVSQFKDEVVTPHLMKYPLFKAQRGEISPEGWNQLISDSELQNFFLYTSISLNSCMQANDTGMKALESLLRKLDEQLNETYTYVPADTSDVGG